MGNQEREVSELLVEWRNRREQLEALLHQRHLGSTQELMEQGINLYVQLLFLSNGLPVSLGASIPFNQFDLKPVNIEERLAFIKSRPSLYHSFRQLSELMVEQEKLFVKHRAMKKSSRPKA
ncbi:YpoC family protein [Neobacillus sp. NPDC093127]|uniref:YpoC family protein n=1 Tax=Neobacillus sp. NPDC093127 TaxID=3364296 RepID=UPI0037FB248A